MVSLSVLLFLSSLGDLGKDEDRSSVGMEWGGLGTSVFSFVLLLFLQQLFRASLWIIS